MTILCDRCGHAARVTFVLRRRDIGDELELSFCAHHAAEVEAGLLASGWRLAVDSRADLIASERGAR